MSDQNANPQGQGQQTSQEPQGAGIIPSLDILGGGLQDQSQIPNQVQEQQQGFQAQPPITPNGQQEQQQGNPFQQQATQEQQQQQSQANSPLEEYSFLSGDGSTLSEQDKEIRNNVFSMFDATSMDATGNLLDANGKIVLSKANLDKFSETGDVPTDADGNQIRHDGSIIRKAEDIAPSFVDATRELVESEFGFQLLDANGKPKTYENSVQGQVDIIKDVYQNATINSVAQFLKSNPQVQNFYYHLANGGSPETYNFKPVDYSNIKVDELDRTAKINLIRTSLERQKVQNVDSLMKTIELSSDEIIHTSASESALLLDKLTKQEREQAEKDYQSQVEKQKQEAVEYWAKVKSVVFDNKVSNINLNDSEKEEFFKYLSAPVNSTGVSQYMIDEESRSLEDDLMIAFMTHKGFKLDDLINLRAKTGKIENLRKRFAGQVPNPRINNEQKPTQQTQGKFDLSLDTIIGGHRQQQ